MQIPQLAPGLGKGPKIGGGFHGGNARQFLGQVVGVVFAVIGGMVTTLCKQLTTIFSVE